MNLKNKMIMEEYRDARQDFLSLGDTISQILQKKIKGEKIKVLSVEHRVKTENSLRGKLELKGDKYGSLADITDILGARIICYFSDDVDKIAAIVEKMFVIDRENSVDKRAQLKPDSFGYLSIHYIASLEDNGVYPSEICEKKFEIQIRSILQHTWAAINHDLGYKSEFGVPKTIKREFSRIASLLEIADEQFVDCRDNIKNYSDEIRKKIADNTAADVPIDMVSLREYVLNNKAMRAFLNELSKICGAEISEIDPESYLTQLAWLGKNTIGDLSEMLEKNHHLALKLAKTTLEKTDLDILSSNVGLRYICRAELLNTNRTIDDITEFLDLSAENKDRAQRQAKRLLSVYGKLKAEKQ